MRSAKAEQDFPYDVKTTCYILVYPDGAVKHIQYTKTDLAEAYSSVCSGKAALYAVWPGKWRSDLFVIDDLNAFADAVGLPREDNHVHKLEWEINKFDDGVSRYANVNCKFKCSCSFSKMGIKKLAMDMKNQKGWVVATSTGYGYHGEEFTISVTRASLKNSK